MKLWKVNRYNVHHHTICLVPQQFQPLHDDHDRDLTCPPLLGRHSTSPNAVWVLGPSKGHAGQPSRRPKQPFLSNPHHDADAETHVDVGARLQPDTSPSVQSSKHGQTMVNSSILNINQLGSTLSNALSRHVPYPYRTKLPHPNSWCSLSRHSPRTFIPNTTHVDLTQQI